MPVIDPVLTWPRVAAMGFAVAGAIGCFLIGSPESHMAGAALVGAFGTAFVPAVSSRGGK